MKASAFFPAALLAAGLVLGAAGCAQQPTIAGSHVSSASRSARTFALSVTLPDGSPITAQQWATVKAAFEQQLAAAGYRLTDDISQAERIIRVVFSPSFEDPTIGTSTVLSVRSNPMYAYNGGYGRPVFAYGFAGYPYGDPFYGNSRYDYSYTYVSNPTTVTPRCDPPGTPHGRPGHDADCSPGTARSDGGQYAHHGGNGGNWGSNHGPGPSSDSGRSWNGGSSSSSRSSDSSYSSGPSYSGYSSSAPSASFSSGSSSYSSSSYSSGPSSSYSSSSSASVPSASFSSGSSSSSSGSSGGSSGTTSNQNAN